MSVAPEYSLNVFDEDVCDNPYPHYAAMRELGPVLTNQYWFGQYMIHRYDDVQQALKDDVHFSSDRGMDADPFKLFRASTLLSADPPEHGRLRTVLSRAFTPRMISGLEPMIRKLASELLAPLADGQDFDLVSEFAKPIPATVIAEMLGVSPEDRVDFGKWADDVVVGIANFFPCPEWERAEESGVLLREYFLREISLRRKNPGEDLISRLVVANADGILNDEELLGFGMLLLLGGNETSANLIGNGALALARNPDQQAALAGDPSLGNTAVDEFLRLDAPVRTDMRRVKTDIEVAGVVIPEGSLLFMLLSAANHDPAQFTDPEKLDIRRSPNPHMSFGIGSHFCLGANLARLEAKVAIEELLKVAPAYSLAGSETDLKYGPNFNFHGPLRLDICR